MLLLEAKPLRCDGGARQCVLTCGIRGRRDSLVGVQQLLGRSILDGIRCAAAAKATKAATAVGMRFAERRWV